jgi:hypothetical protein
MDIIEAARCTNIFSPHWVLLPAFDGRSVAARRRKHYYVFSA